MVTLNRILAQLEKVRQIGDQKWMARCPAHDDRTPSLSIRYTDEGRILLHCFAGCEFHEIVAALGCSIKDLSPSQGEEPPTASPSQLEHAKWVLRIAEADIKAGRKHSAKDRETWRHAYEVIRFNPHPPFKAGDS